MIHWTPIVVGLLELAGTAEPAKMLLTPELVKSNKDGQKQTAKLYKFMFVSSSCTATRCRKLNKARSARLFASANSMKAQCSVSNRSCSLLTLGWLSSGELATDNRKCDTALVRTHSGKSRKNCFSKSQKSNSSASSNGSPTNVLIVGCESKMARISMMRVRKPARRNTPTTLLWSPWCVLCRTEQSKRNWKRLNHALERVSFMFFGFWLMNSKETTAN